MTNIHGDKKKGLDIAKAVLVHINSISIETDMDISETKEYTIIINSRLEQKFLNLNYRKVGNTDIQAKLWRKSGPNTKSKLRTLFNACIEAANMPKEWKIA
ncbi:hypothetical protein G9A89_016003 [Geosiphon pyriformis]|nr:hypothetical protein G9A89_016003 [Geosiphon pyriformis]